MHVYNYSDLYFKSNVISKTLFSPRPTRTHILVFFVPVDRFSRLKGVCECMYRVGAGA